VACPFFMAWYSANLKPTRCVSFINFSEQLLIHCDSASESCFEVKFCRSCTCVCGRVCGRVCYDYSGKRKHQTIDLIEIACSPRPILS
jgi:hypothetical protein